MGCSASKQADDLREGTERVMSGRRGIGASERIRTPSERIKVQARRTAILEALKDENDKTSIPSPDLKADGSLTAKEVAMRISGSTVSKDCVLGDLRSEGGIIRASYAALTQRGYYPDNPHKENQDAYCVVPSKFAGGEGDGYFAVFDGHGDLGHDCASFAKQILHAHISAGVKRKRASLNSERLRKLTKEGGVMPKNAFHPSQWPYLSSEQYESCVREAHIKCNEEMHKSKVVKDQTAGDHGHLRLVSRWTNMREQRWRQQSSMPAEEEKREIDQSDSGDGHDNGSLVAIPLSEDQTPYRKDERERLKKSGARVCSIDQMEGLEPMHENWGEVDLGVDIDVEGDPPRVWLADRNFPGCAFSRSLGDDIGEGVGVNAEPEFITKDVTRGDEILVIASDGVFEFLTNQRVVDICAASTNPVEACTRLLEEAYAEWLRYELRTDDITCIVIFLKTISGDNTVHVQHAGLPQRVTCSLELTYKTYNGKTDWHGPNHQALALARGAEFYCLPVSREVQSTLSSYGCLCKVVWGPVMSLSFRRFSWSSDSVMMIKIITLSTLFHR
ncbi:hypothetical protein THAOC_07616 [Thalassiosira oceanica]|uniref:PPM-type phosphatase domain-containing protein n=1 Tax=Thalassiosira oceanica TaxID=159749 RepID=K0TK05_THAOC|nr:hypothetical protein THAOC_07616 [Thalassiosira oceanica]|eukprot:EJK70982.1 hypothetical protein THAOC_07616 [Thalassiosira oceanica]